LSLTPSLGAPAPAGTPTYDLFVSYAPADRSWVEGYLMDALRAAGVRCTTEAEFALGAPRLSELEHAVRSSRRTLLVVSPAYLADAYAPFGDLLAQTFGLETGTWPVIPLIFHDASLPTRLSALTSVDATDMARWDEAIEALCRALDRPVPTAGIRPPCPYPGMLPFAEEDEARFFGRDAEVAEMVERLRLHPFLAVIGPSGTGKSSLVFAGLLPRLRASGLFGSGDWSTVVLRPGPRPLDALAAALDDRLGQEAGGDRLLVVCDQFEEAFTVGRAQALDFERRLWQLTQSGRCWVVVTVRADFYADLMHSPLWEEIRTHRMEVAPLGDAALRAAIERPARDVGVHLDPALAERLLADSAAQPGILPLLQETLVLLWERLERRYLPLDAYEMIGRAAGNASDGTDGTAVGMHAAIARRADAALVELDTERAAIARRIFVRLVQFGEGRADTRRQQRVGELRSIRDDPTAFDTTLTHLVDQRLLTSSGSENGDDRRIDLAHEALIAGWPALRVWLAERRGAEQVRRQLEAKAGEWIRLGRGRGGLLDDVELGEAERWLGDPDASELGHDAALDDLVTASRRALDAVRAGRRRRIRALVGGLSAGLLLVAGLAIWGAVSARTARDQADKAQRAETVAEERRVEAEVATVEAEERRVEAEGLARSALGRQVAAEAIGQVDHRFDRALLLGAEAYRIDPTVQTQGALLSALQFSPRLITYLRPADAGAEPVEAEAVTFSPDGGQIVMVDSTGALQAWDAFTAEPLGGGFAVAPADTVPAMTFSTDGRWLVVGSCPRDGEVTCEREEVRVWDVAAREAVGQPISWPDGYITAVAISADGSRVAAGGRQADRGTIRVFDVADGQPVGRPMRTEVQSLEFSPDGRTLVSGLPVVSNAGGEAGLVLWDLASQRRIAATDVYVAGGVWSLAFTPDGTVIAAGHGDGTVALRSATDLAPLGDPLEAPTGVSDLQVSPDGSRLAAANSGAERVVVWTGGDSIGPPEELAGHGDVATSVAFSPDSTRLVSAAADGGLVVWHADDDQALLTGTRWTGEDDGVAALALRPDSGVVAVGQEPFDTEPAAGLELDAWDSIGLSTIDAQLPVLGAPALDTDGTVLAVAAEDGSIRFFDPITGDPSRSPIEAFARQADAITVGADGRTIAGSGCTALEDDECASQELAVWDVASGELIASGPWNAASGARELALSPDGRTLAASAGYEEVVLWDVTSGTPIGEPLSGADRVEQLAWSPDGSRLAVASAWGGAHAPNAGDRDNNHVAVWDVAGRARVAEPLVTDDFRSPTAVAFSADGQFLAAGYLGGEVRVWSAATLDPIGRSTAPGLGYSPVQALRFSADGTTLGSAHGDGRINLWDLNPESWLHAVCAAAGRNLDGQEWEQFVGTEVPYERTCPEFPAGS
jgi:WD40 repeat protein